ncbi:hypothetical protein ACLBKU_17345 [Erythrobacter sp. NE805]|uniref:hypothetical protein n=1 Tax=Erythrobacter sp. NE805 TaxID=3389875 RepID=UPI00396B3D28
MAEHRIGEIPYPLADRANASPRIRSDLVDLRGDRADLRHDLGEQRARLVRIRGDPGLDPIVDFALRPAPLGLPEHGLELRQRLVVDVVGIAVDGHDAGIGERFDQEHRRRQDVRAERGQQFLLAVERAAVADGIHADARHQQDGCHEPGERHRARPGHCLDRHDAWFSSAATRPADRPTLRFLRVKRKKALGRPLCASP